MRYIKYALRLVKECYLYIVEYYFEQVFTVVGLLIMFFLFFYDVIFEEEHQKNLGTLGFEANQRGDFSTAIFYFNLAEMTSCCNSDSKGDIFYGRGAAKFFLNDTVGAKKDFLRSIEIDSTIIGMYVVPTADTTSFFYSNSKIAEELLEFAILKYSGWYLPYVYRGKLKMFLKDYAGALGDYNQALTKDTSEYEIYGYRAEVYSKLGNFNMVILDCSKELIFAKENRKPLLKRGMAKIEMGDTLGGCLDFHRIDDTLLYEVDRELIEKYCSSL